MEDLRVMHKATLNARDDWEDWTDDEPATPIKHGSLVPFVPSLDSPLSSKPHNQAPARRSKSRQSSSKIQRLKSRKRQKAQNEKAGIKLVTDMTRFRQAPHHVARLAKPATPAPASPYANEESTVKFVDASALRALEGSPSSASVGNWAWLKNSPSATTPTPTPDGNKILIGYSFPEGHVADKAISPQTAVVATPIYREPAQPPSTQPIQDQQSKSVWSPDTEDGLSPSRFFKAASSLDSTSIGVPGQSNVLRVPAMPSSLKHPTKSKLSKNDFDDDDNYTPVTLFEEDGGKTPRSAASKGSLATTRSRSGWWDHIRTPFRERFSPTSKSEKEEHSRHAADEWWNSPDEKKAIDSSQPQTRVVQQTSSSSSSSTTLRPPPSPVPVIRVPTPTIASSSRSSPPIISDTQESHPEKEHAIMEEHFSLDESPPPYERNPSVKQAQPTRYRAVFPPGHPLASQFPPSPQPISPGLDGTMAPQGLAIKMADMPLAPAAARGGVSVPDRPAGAHPGEHFVDVSGNMPAAKVERSRRRHEKEDYIVRKVGGFWKGRGCIPEGGCYGRSGREGRKRRRVWLGVCIVFLLLTVLGVVLGVELSRRIVNHPSAAASPESVWLNLTGFPPIPTGLSTVVGPDNSEAVTGCVDIPTLWSCSLSPEEQAANEPYDADQPMFIFQIQYDNSTRQLWDIPNGTPPTPTESADTATSTAAASSSASATTISTSTTSTTSSAAAATTNANAITRRSTTLYDTGIDPNPDPPSFDEMWFLGNTTDEVVSSDKAGEPTPFYISFFTSINDSAGPNVLADAEEAPPSTAAAAVRRGTGNGIGSGASGSDSLGQFLPAPVLNADGTGAAAQLRPYPSQQPLRLFDRGLPTEHYGFYSYFNKTVYLESVANDTSSSSSTTSEDAGSGGGGGDGGVLETNARWLVTWTQARFVVKIWTRMGNTTRLVGGRGVASANVTSAVMPGTFPYPVTVGEDTHGGDGDTKAVFAYAVEADQHVNTTDNKIFDNDVGFGGAVVNPRLEADLSWGGIDGGTGGCRCEWVNWVDDDGEVGGGTFG